MRALLIGVVMIGCSLIAVAQKLPYDRLDTLDKRPLLTVNGKTADPLSLYTLSKDDVADLKWLSPEKAAQKFGADGGKYGAVEITLNPKAKVLTWDQLLKSFYFNKSPDQMTGFLSLGLGFAFDMNAPQFLLVSPSNVFSVGVEPVWGKPGLQVVVYSPYIELEQEKRGKFDAVFKTISQIFEDEADKRQKIAASKIVVRG